MVKKFITALTTTGLLFGSIVPAFGAVNVGVVGNGAFSDTVVGVNQTCTQTVKQSNKLNSVVDLTVVANTGGNNASFNTGSGVDIDTGSATNDVSVSVIGGVNQANVPNCCCGEEENGVDVVVADNGAFADQTVGVNTSKSQKVKQKSRVRSTVTGKVKANTGKNKAKYNTGGTQNVSTDDADNTVGVTVVGTVNVLNGETEL